MASARLNPALRRILRAPIALYRWNCGWLLGNRFLMLVHTGRRTGKRRYTVLEVIEYRKEGPEMIVMSGFGRNSDWFRNIEAAPDIEVAIGPRRFAASWRLLDKEEATKVIAGYERRNRIAAPIVRAVLSRILGWRYDGSESGRGRLVEELPLVAFRLTGR